MNTRIACIAITVCLATITHADIYRWTDESGQVHFGDRPPSHGQRIDTDTEPVVDADSGLRPGERDLLNRIRRDEQAREAARRREEIADHKAEHAAAYNRQHCAKLQRRIDDAISELRGGYTASRGETLRKRIKRDREDMREQCR